MEEENKKEVSGIEEAEKNLVEIFSEEATSKGENWEEANSTYEVRDNFKKKDQEEKSTGGKKMGIIILGLVVIAVIAACVLILTLKK